MTREQLLGVKDFETLRNDPRFKALLGYLRAVVPHPQSPTGDWFVGRLSVFDQIDSVWPEPPKNDKPSPPRPQYQRPKHQRIESAS